MGIGGNMKRLLLASYWTIVPLVLLRALTNGDELIAYFDLTSLTLVFIPAFLAYLISRDVALSMIGGTIGGVFGLVLGALLTFSSGITDVQAILVGFSVSLLPLLYSLTLNLILLPLYIIKK